MGKTFFFIIAFIFVILFSVTSVWGLLKSPELLFGINAATSLVYGFFIGFLLSVIGYVMLVKVIPWNNSMSYLVGHELLKGNIFILFLLSLAAGILEELYTRGLLLIIYNKRFAGELNIDVALLFFLVNIIWTLNHLFHRKKEFEQNMTSTIQKSMPHLLIIFLSGIPFTWLTFQFNSLIPAMVAHFTLDFVFGIIYRRHVKISRSSVS